MPLTTGIFLLVEAYKRFRNPNPIDTGLMLVVAAIGLLANLLSVLLLHGHVHGSINVRSAYLHLVSDTLSSVAVVAGGLAIRYYIIREGYDILKESVDVLMEASPELDFDAIKAELESIPGVKNAHHFHAWRIGENETHFECHVDVNDMSLSEAQRIIDEIEKIRSMD